MRGILRREKKWAETAAFLGCFRWVHSLVFFYVCFDVPSLPVGLFFIIIIDMPAVFFLNLYPLSYSYIGSPPVFFF
jgi:hypothetical protein